jgi:formiminotetrahydrofolate cyclodeaminase
MPLKDLTVSELLERLAAKTSTPGGGAVAGLTGATAVALAHMVVRFSIGKPDLVAHAELLAQADRRLEQSRGMFLELADADVAAFEMYMTARKRAATDPARPTALAQATNACLDVPLRVLAETRQVAILLRSLTDKTNPRLHSDLLIAAHLLIAVAHAAMGNVRENLPSLPESRERDVLQHQAKEQLRDSLADLNWAIEAFV